MATDPVAELLFSLLFGGRAPERRTSHKCPYPGDDPLVHEAYHQAEDYLQNMKAILKTVKSKVADLDTEVSIDSLLDELKEVGDRMANLNDRFDKTVEAYKKTRAKR